MAVGGIFLFHSNIHIQCDYGLFTPFIKMGAIYMTAFFILSGFSLYWTWKNRDLHRIEGIGKFYLKRLIGIMPLYYVVAILVVLFLGKETLFQNLLIAPIELLGIQSVFDSLFGYSHNGGTWFISCILMCYAVYPLIQEITKQLNLKAKIIIVVASVFVLLYSPLIVHFFHTSGIYSNPFFRIVEFSIGVIICSLIKNITEKKISRFIYSWWAILLEYAILVIGVTVGVQCNIAVGNYMLYSWVALPMFMFIIVSMFGVKFPKSMYDSKLIRYLSRISYAFFLAQFFTWEPTMFVIHKLGIDTNISRIVISFLICLSCTVILHEMIEKKISKILKEKYM